MRTQTRYMLPQNQGWTMTLVLVIVFGVCFVLGWLPGVGETVANWTMLDPSHALPWSLITYPLASLGGMIGLGFFFFLIWMAWFYSFGSQLERSVGTLGMLWHFLGATALCGVVYSLAVFMKLGMGMPLTGPDLPIAALAMVFFGMNRSQVFCFWGVSIPSPWLAVIIGAFVLFNYGAGQPMLGLALVAPLLVGWFYGVNYGAIGARKSAASSKKEKAKENREFHDYMDKVKSKEKEREERERLRKLFEDSLDDEKK